LFFTAINTDWGIARPELAEGLFQTVPAPEIALPPLPFFHPLSLPIFSFPAPLRAPANFFIRRQQIALPEDFFDRVTGWLPALPVYPHPHRMGSTVAHYPYPKRGRGYRTMTISGNALRCQIFLRY